MKKVDFMKQRINIKSVSVDVNTNMNFIFVFKFIIDLHKFCYEIQLLVWGYLETKNFLIVQIRAGLDNQTTQNWYQVWTWLNIKAH